MKPAIGKLLDKNDNILLGTAFAVSPLHAFTAFHCIGNRNTGKVLRKQVLLEFLTGDQIVGNYEVGSPVEDYAVLLLQSPLPKSLKPIPLLDQAYIHQPFRALGYPSSVYESDEPKPDVYTIGGKVRNEDTSIFGGVPAIQLFTDEGAAGFSLHGMSGGPVLVGQNPEGVIGLVRWNVPQKDNHELGEGGDFWACPTKLIIEKHPEYPDLVLYDELQDTLKPITIEVLEYERQIAWAKLKEIEQLEGEEYEVAVNEEALVGHLPQWHHLYMEKFGIFTRHDKEQTIFSDIEKGIQKLIKEREGGLFFHIISGDSGCGKSTIAKQIIRQLLEQQEFTDYPIIQSTLNRLRVFEVQQIDDWEKLETAILKFLVHQNENFIHLVFLDDLFAFEDSEVNKTLSLLKRAASVSSIYFLVTSPSWLFDKRDLQQKKKLFELIGYLDTKIYGVDNQDRIALSQQYEAIYKEKCRPELIAQLNREHVKDNIILLRLSLHHNLDYSQYLDQLFVRLESKEPKYLAALILFSTLSRFYVHFPVTLIKSFNEDLPQTDKLWEDAYDYEDINELGFRLFRVRKGGKNFTSHNEIPDTIAPFHDRVAQVIYNTWGEKRRNVPIFNCKLWELRKRVYRELDDIDAHPLLANIFRGHLSVADAQEMRRFVDEFGPVRQGQWRLAKQPIASHRWINYSKYNFRRTKLIRRSWENALEQTITISPDAGALLMAVMLNPTNISHFEKRAKNVSIEQLDGNYISIIISVLEQLLRRKPLPFAALGNYLLQVDMWLDKYSNTTQHFLSYRYFVIAALTLLNVNQPSTKLDRIKELNQSLKRIIKTYLLNIRSEYRSNALLGTRGLLTLVKKVKWDPLDSKQLQVVLTQYLQENDDAHTYKPVVFEHLLFFLRIKGSDNLISIRELTDTYYTICSQNAEFPGLTFTSKRLWEHLIGYSKKYPEDYKSLLKEIIDDLISNRLEAFVKSEAYPDFVAGLLKHLSFNRYAVTVKEIVSFLRPILLYFEDTQQSTYVFWEARKLRIDETFSPLSEIEGDNIDKEIQLCLAESLHISIQLVLQNFITLLLNAQITSHLVVATSLVSHLRFQQPKSISSELLQEYREQFYHWLKQNKDKEEASLYFVLVCSKILFDTSKLHNLEIPAARNIQSIPNLIHPRYFPFDYLKWWLSHSILYTVMDQRYLLLNSFWDYLLRNSHIQYKDRFIIYEDYFLFLLSRYGLKQDEIWWGNAITQLINYYEHLWQESQKKSSSRAKKTQKNITKAYKQQLCLEKILEIIVQRFEMQRDQLQGAFEESIKRDLANHNDYPWKARWLSKIYPQVDMDGTVALLNYLDLMQGQIESVFDLRNQLNWWYKWIVSSDQALETELTKIIQWANNQRNNSIAILLLPNLLDIAKSEILWLDMGETVQQIVSKSNAEFRDVSYLTSRYLEYISVFDLNHVANEEVNLIRIMEWYFDQAPNWKALPETSYGLQTAFKTCSQYKLFPSLDKAEKAFFQVTESQINREEGGAISRDYFPWYFNNPKQWAVKILRYLDWLRDNYQARQAPYILVHILKALQDSTLDLEKQQIVVCWDLVKLFIDRKLNHEGATLSAELFWKYLMKGYSNATVELATLDQVSEEYFKICQQKIEDDRTVYLVTSFLPFWNNLVQFPSNQDMLSLWQAMLLVRRRNIEAFGKLSRDLGNHIRQTENTELILKFHEMIIQFMEKYPQATLSAKFASLLSTHQVYADRVAKILPKLIVSQGYLEDLGYAFKRFFTYLANKIDASLLIEYEISVLTALQDNLNKNYAELCVHNVIKGVTPKVHYEAISQLFRRYITIGREPKDKRQEDFFWQVIGAYHKYEIDSSIDISIRRENVRANLLILQRKANKTQSSRYFTAFLGTWSVDCIPQQAAVNTLREIVLEIPHSRWRRVLAIFKAFGKSFDLTLLISPGLSVEKAIRLFESDEQQGFISIKQLLTQSAP